ncbi:hypothetical protein JOM56_004096 [Amanita muscaria]
MAEQSRNIGFIFHVPRRLTITFLSYHHSLPHSIPSNMNTPLIPPSQIPSSQSSVPQIRSRITVVCAECKRLKLKCDRRNPCGSCTKRDTVSRCIYSPAAAEKVDLHSLNNRLIQVEATLSLITSGQTPPMFQSSYPYSQIQPNTIATPHSPNSRITTQTPTGLSHQHHHHNSAPFSSANGSISLSSEDLSSIWLDELDDIDSPPFDVKISHPLKTNADFVKLEMSSYTHFNNTSQLLPQATHVHIDLPPISVYYATPERISETQSTSEIQTLTPCVPPQSDAFNGTTPASKPSITPSLVALLPSLVRTRQLLRKAAGVLRERPVPLPASLLSSLSDGINGAGADINGRNNIKGKKGKDKTYFPSLTTHWDALEFRVMHLITNRGLGRGTSTKATDRKERAKMSARARAIFFGGGSSSAAPSAEPPLTPQSRTQNTKRDSESEFDATERTTKERSESLPFFAAVCLLLALGTTASQTTGSEPHVDAPSQSFTGSETESPEFFYTLAQQSLDVWENNLANLSVPNAEDKEAVKAEEDEKLDYLVAGLLTVGYQLYEPFARRKGKDSERRRVNALNKAFSSVGKMVNMARAMGLGKDRKSPVRCKDEKGTSNGKDAKKKVRAEERRKRRDDLRRLIWWDIGFYELFISDALGHSSLLSSSPCMVQFPRCADLSPSNDGIESGQEDAQQEPSSYQDEECLVYGIVGKYHGARCRLTKIAQTIKQKLAHPDCCCGYTLDQAAQLEGEVNRFVEGLPPPLRFLFKEEGKEVTTTRSQDMQPTTDEAQQSMQRSQLAIMTQRLIMMVYLPFLRQHSESRPSNFSSPAVTATLSDHSIDSTDQQSDDSAWNPALQSTVNAAQCIIQASKALLQWPISDRPPDQLLVPSLLDLYPLEKILLDAVIICTHATTFHGTLFSCHQAIEYASSALEMLLGMDLDPNHKTLLERVKKRFNITIQNRDPPSLYGVKRKHDSIGVEGRGRGAEASKSHTYSSHPSTEVQLTGDRPSQRATQNDIPADLTKPSCAESARSSRDPETGQKSKKHAKKNHQYPAVGIRVRQRKDGQPLLLKNRFNSPLTSVPNPGRESPAETPRQERRVQMNAMVMPVDEQDFTSLGDFGPSQHQQSPREDPTPPVMSSLLDDPRYQSSSASLSQDLHLHLHSQHESRPASVAYSTAYIEMYEQGQKLSSQEVQMSSSHSDSFDGNKNHDASSAFNHVSHISGPVESNPYGTSRHLSSSSSPYLANGSDMTLTPFKSATQTITPSPYAQEPTLQWRM